MFAPFVQARLGAVARFATTAFLAILLLVAGWTPTRALPTLAAAGVAQATGRFVQLGAQDSARAFLPAPFETGTPDGGFDATAVGSERLAVASRCPLASPRVSASAATRPAARFRPRAPPVAV